MENMPAGRFEIFGLSLKKLFNAPSLRIIIPMGLTFILFVVGVFLFFIPFMEEQLMAQKRLMIKELTDNAWSLLAQYENEVQEGDFSLKQAQKKAMNRICKLRYGSEGKDYFWINDMHPKMLMHPYRPDLDGKDLSDYRDSKGKKIFVEFVNAVKRRNAGYVDYAWQWKDDPERIARKISYVRGFKPWGWIVGTGIYVEDVRKEIAAFSRRMVLFSSVVLILVLLFAVYIIRESVKTERKRIRADEMLHESQKKYKNLYEESRKALEIYRSFLLSSADAIILYDMEGKAQYVNRAFTEIFGWTEAEVLEEKVPFLPESEREKSMTIIKNIVENGTPCHNLITKRLTKKGRLLDVSISASRFETYEGDASGLFVILRDISEKIALETQFYEAQKMESVGTLAGGIAHDFNNLLMAIQGNVSMVLLNQRLDREDYERIQNIEQYVQKGAHLTKQLLGFARGGKYEVKPTNLNELIANSVALFTQAKKEITIHMELEKRVWMVAVDRGQIDQVLMNLYVNAAQAMPKGGEMLVHTQNLLLSKEQSKAFDLKPGRYVKVSVADAGVGMDEEIRKRIFDPFFTTRAVGEGTGLGLASAYGIIQNHGGAISVESETGMWSTVRFLLPAVSAEAERKEVALPAGRILKGDETILLVDDEEMIIDIGSEFLKRMGYRVITAQNGAKALKLYEKKQDEVSLVILDMVMPDMTGEECFEKLRHMNSSVKILLSSGYSIEGQAGKILERGCNGFIQKPFKIAQLSRMIRKILDSPE
jgi:two-component system cell cycle sensor histidine kinase/response regulator CckA